MSKDEFTAKIKEMGYENITDENGVLMVLVPADQYAEAAKKVFGIGEQPDTGYKKSFGVRAVN
ncbi:MAG: hypothetical protein J5949_08575 [Oscillospiraceae bacterium]|nr:hypothetical protein [Oscillospiraceae bacterium]